MMAALPREVRKMREELEKTLPDTTHADGNTEYSPGSVVRDDAYTKALAQRTFELSSTCVGQDFCYRGSIDDSWTTEEATNTGTQYNYLPNPLDGRATMTHNPRLDPTGPSNDDASLTNSFKDRVLPNALSQPSIPRSHSDRDSATVTYPCTSDTSTMAGMTDSLYNLIDGPGMEFDSMKEFVNFGDWI